MNLLFCRLIHQIDAYDHLLSCFDNLKHQIQVPLQAGGITDGNDCIRMCKAYVIPRNLLFLGMCHK